MYRNCKELKVTQKTVILFLRQCPTKLKTLFCRDYRPMPGLDRYDNEDLDDENYDAMSIGDRAAAEQELRRRDRDEGRIRRDDRDLLYGKSQIINFKEGRSSSSHLYFFVCYTISPPIIVNGF